MRAPSRIIATDSRKRLDTCEDRWDAWEAWYVRNDDSPSMWFKTGVKDRVKGGDHLSPPSHWLKLDSHSFSFISPMRTSHCPLRSSVTHSFIPDPTTRFRIRTLLRLSNFRKPPLWREMTMSLKIALRIPAVPTVTRSHNGSPMIRWSIPYNAIQWL